MGRNGQNGLFFGKITEFIVFRCFSGVIRARAREIAHLKEVFLGADCFAILEMEPRSSFFDASHPTCFYFALPDGQKWPKMAKSG